MSAAVPGRQAGLSLTELMVALSIGLVLLLTVGYIVSGSMQIFRQQNENARIQETSRFLLDTLGRQIIQAGYAAISTDYTDTKMEFAGTPISGEHEVGDIRAEERKAGSDYLALSFDATTDCHGNAVAGAAQNEFYLNNQDELICASGGATEVMAEGVEAFRVRYGVDSDGDFTVERYLDTPADWAQVRTVRVCVVVHALANGTAPANQSYEDCEGVQRVAADTRLRRTLNATFQLRNRGS